MEQNDSSERGSNGSKSIHENIRVNSNVKRQFK